MSTPTALGTDANILAQARRVLAAVSAEAIPDPPVRATVVDGTITVSGNAATSAAASDLCARLQQIPGVKDVVDRIIDDGSLQKPVRSIIASHEPASGGVRKVHVVMGTVYVDWGVRNRTQEHDLRAALLLVPGVRAVVHGEWSRLQDAERARSKTSMSRSSQPSAG